MAHTSEQNPKDGGQNSATTGTVAAGPNVPATSTAARPSSQQAPATASSTSQHPEHEDKEYDPSAEALIDDIDDERTLEEEEALAGDNSTAVQNELDDLKRESEMPIEELLAYYTRMRAQEGAQEGEEEEEEEFDDDEEDEDEDMEEEGEDEVRKKQSFGASVKNDSQSTQHSHRHQSTTGNQQQQQANQQQQPPPPTEMTTQAPPQVNPPLSNSHLSSPPKQPSQLNSQTPPKLPQQQSPPKQMQQCLVDLKDTPAQDTQTSGAVIHTDNAQRTPQPDFASQQPQILQDQYRPSAHPPAVQEQTISIECLDSAPQTLMSRDTDAQPNDIRHRRSMTEFLVDSGNASNSILKTFLDYDLDDSDDYDEDYSYTDDENVDDERDWRRVIHVGAEYQADVPETLSEYENDLPPYENQDTLVWRCRDEQTKDELIDYLKRASAIPRRNDISISPASVPKISNQEMQLYRERMHDIGGNRRAQTGEANHENAANHPQESLRDVYMSQSRKRLRIDCELEQENAMDGMNQPYGDAIASDNAFQAARDENSSSTSQDNRPGASTEEYFHGEEQLLFLLLQCNHNIEEALRRRHLDPFKYYIAEPMSLWSQEECLGFEHGLRTFGKNFYLIREEKVPTRSRAEVVAFYYLWKKSERHDVYTTQYKLDRKRSLTHPGTTDYMDKFIEDNESALNASSTHTPTPTESTVEANQLSDTHHDGTALLLTKCRLPEMTQSMIACPDEPSPNNVSGQKESTNSNPIEDTSGPVQDNQIFLGGNTAI